MKSKVAERQTQAVLELMQKAKDSGSNWLSPFKRSCGGFQNFFSKKNYRGGNVLMCALFGNGDTQFGTLNQWKNAGYRVKLEEMTKPVELTFWKLNEKEHVSKETGEKYTSKWPLLRYYKVWGTSQLEEPPVQDEVDGPVVATNDEVEDYITNTGAVVNREGGKACYIPSKDEIHMPRAGLWTNIEQYYPVLLHELTHWTGHKERLDRFSGKNNMFGSKDYAFEELVAELGAVFQAHLLGLQVEPREDHAHYLNNWIQALQNDSRFILEASKQAQKAVDFIENLQVTEQMEAA